MGDAELEGSCEDLPEDKTLREKIWNFFGCGDEEAAPGEEVVETEEVVEEAEQSTTEVEEVVEVADEIPAENSIKEAVQSFLGINEEDAEEPIVSADQATEDPATEETQTVEEEVIASDESETEENSIKAALKNFLSGSDEKAVEEEETVEESVADVPIEIFEETVTEEEITEEVIEIVVEEVVEEVLQEVVEEIIEDSVEQVLEEIVEEGAEETVEGVVEESSSPDKPSFKERILNFFRRSKPTPEAVPVVEEVVQAEETLPVETKEVKESIKTRIGKFFNIFQSKSDVTDLESEIAESIVNGNVKEMMENSEKEPIVIDTIGLCPEITKDNWLQLFMGRSFLCFVSFSLNLSVLIASYLLYF